MVNLEDSEIRIISGKQINLIQRLLASRNFSKKEFEFYSRITFEEIRTSSDGALIIDVLLKTLRFRRIFLTSKNKAHLKCQECKTRKDLKRLLSLPEAKQVVVCESCFYADNEPGIVTKNHQIQNGSRKEILEKPCESV